MEGSGLGGVLEAKVGDLSSEKAAKRGEREDACQIQGSLGSPRCSVPRQPCEKKFKIHQPEKQEPRRSEGSSGGNERDERVDALLFGSEGVLDGGLLGEGAGDVIGGPSSRRDGQEKVRGEREGEERVGLRGARREGRRSAWAQGGRARKTGWTNERLRSRERPDVEAESKGS